VGWLAGWDQRVKLTIDHTDIDAILALLNFPVLIYLSTSSGRNNDDVSFVFDELTSDANRKKIAVTRGDGTTECYVEIEKWDDANEQAWLWVKVPSISSSVDTDLYLYYDVDHADNTTYVDDTETGNSVNVWDSGFKTVYHMRDKTASSIADSTTNNNDGTKKDAGEPVVTTAGKIDGAQHFDGGNDYITAADGARLVTTSPFTVEGWFNADTSTEGTVIAQRYTNSYFNYLVRWNNVANKLGCYVSREFLQSSVLGTGTWYHFAVVYDGITTTTFYINTVSQGTITGALDYHSSATVRIGQDGGTLGTPFDGLVDEVRLSDTIRNAAWIKATYESGRDDLVDFGTEETVPVGQPYQLRVQHVAGMKKW